MKLNDEKGITLVDISLSIIILTLFVIMNVALFYNTYISAKKAERSAEATNYLIKIAEMIQFEEYENVETDMQIENQMLELSSGYTYKIEVGLPTYKTIENPQNIIKIVSIKVYYTVASEVEEVSLRTLKIKEQ